MNNSHQNSDVCPYCGKTLIHTSTNFLSCSDKKCKSHVFVVGNRVIHQDRVELGVGIIQRVDLGSNIPSFLEDLPLPILPNDASPKSTSKYITNQNTQNVRYVILFEGFSNKKFYPAEIRHHLLEINQKVRYLSNQFPLSKKTPKNLSVGTINNIMLQTADGLIEYDLISVDGKIEKIAENRIFGVIDNPLAEFQKKKIATPREFLLRFWSFQLESLYASNLMKIVTNSRLSLLPHQVGVAHLLLQQGNARYVLADEVGLGKTIEAGIFIKEMLARKLAARVLIITPASITNQWEFEMKNKFNLEFIRLTSKIVKDLTVNYESGNLYSSILQQDLTLCTATIQYARLDDCQEILPEIEWDIVVFDEAHHLRRYLENQKTERYRTTLAYDLAQKLSAKTKSLLLLTATPIQLHSFDLFSLIQLLNPLEFPTFDSFEIERKQIPILNMIVRNLLDFTSINAYQRSALPDQILMFDRSYSASELEKKLQFKPRRLEIVERLEDCHFLSRYVIRNRRRLVFPDNKIKRVPNIIEVELSPQEKVVYDKIHQYLAKIYAFSHESKQSGLGFVMVVLQKLLTSSPAALIKSMKNRIKYLEENQDTLQSIAVDLNDSEFTEDEASQDVYWGLDDLDFEDRQVVKQRKQKMKPKKVSVINIKDHIKILKEFKQDLEQLTVDTKADMLMQLISNIFRSKKNEKILLFTQFKQTLFYIHRLLKIKGFNIVEFHGDLSEDQKNASVHKFRKDAQIMLSTEIGGEGRNFQFCHIIVNYDLPWNPMRLEQRIGRLDRFGQTDNVMIYNFYIQDTVESSIVTAITDRIRLFEESIGALEPILGDLERQITSLVLEGDESPLQFRINEVIAKTTDEIDKVYDQLEDLILDKKSFQYDQISKDLDHPDLITGIDIHSFLEEFATYSSDFSLGLSSQIDAEKSWNIHLSTNLQHQLYLHGQYQGYFDLDLARMNEEYDFFALGHPLLTGVINKCMKDDFCENATILPLKIKNLVSLFLHPNLMRLPAEENQEFQLVLRSKQSLNLFIMQIEYKGIVVEKSIITMLVSDDLQVFPTVATIFKRPHNIAPLVAYDQNPELVSVLTPKILQDAYKKAKQAVKPLLQQRVMDLTEINRQKYEQKLQSLFQITQQKQNYAETQLKQSQDMIRVNKLKLPTPKQLENIEKIEIPHKRQARLDQFQKIEDKIHYYEAEEIRWQQVLDALEFDVPAQKKRLNQYKQLVINAKFLAYARVFFV